jgi:hypothetical protein
MTSRKPTNDLGLSDYDFDVLDAINKGQFVMALEMIKKSKGGNAPPIHHEVAARFHEANSPRRHPTARPPGAPVKEPLVQWKLGERIHDCLSKIPRGRKTEARKSIARKLGVSMGTLNNALAAYNHFQRRISPKNS